jgi:hypothetical protein
MLSTFVNDADMTQHSVRRKVTGNVGEVYETLFSWLTNNKVPRFARLELTANPFGGTDLTATWTDDKWVGTDA